MKFSGRPSARGGANPQSVRKVRPELRYYRAHRRNLAPQDLPEKPGEAVRIYRACGGVGARRPPWTHTSPTGRPDAPPFPASARRRHPPKIRSVAFRSHRAKDQKIKISAVFGAFRTSRCQQPPGLSGKTDHSGSKDHKQTTFEPVETSIFRNRLRD